MRCPACGRPLRAGDGVYYDMSGLLPWGVAEDGTFEFRDAPAERLMCAECGFEHERDLWEDFRLQRENKRRWWGDEE